MKPEITNYESQAEYLKVHADKSISSELEALLAEAVVNQDANERKFLMEINRHL